jgi:hypothetical protein
MTHTNITRLARAISVSAVVAIASMGCAAPATAPTPDIAVERAFTAYKTGSKSGVNNQLSRVGHASADFFCRGDGWACLDESYHHLGNNLTSAVEVTRKAEASARVVLKTTWTKYPASVCQEYSVDQTGAGWGITYIDVPKNC